MIVCSVMMYNRNPMLFVLLVVLTGVSSTLTSTNDTNSSVSTWLQISPEVMRNVPLNLKKQLQEQASKTIPRTRRNAHFGYWPYTRPAVPTLLYGPTPRVHERYIANNVDRRYWPYQMMKNSYYVPPAYNDFTRFPRTKHFYERYIANNVDRWYWPYQMLKNSYYVPSAYNAFTRFPRTKHFMKKSRLMLSYNYWSQPRPAHHIPNSIMSTNPTFMDNIFTSSSKPTTPVTPENNYEELVLPILVTHSTPSYDDDNPNLAPDTVTSYEGSTSYTTDANSQSTNNETTGNVSSNTEEMVLTTPSYTEITETYKQYEVDQLSSNQLKEKYFKTVEIFDRNLYQVTFAKLSNSSEEGRQENGISFVQSGLLLHLVLTALSPAVDQKIRTEIEDVTGYAPTEEERTLILKSVLSWLPSSSATLKFRRAARLVAAPAVPVGEGLGLRVDRLNGTEGPEELARVLNDMVEKDSGGSLRETFEEDELIGGVCAALLSTAYLRARWRAAPTLLNHSRAFRRPSPAAPGDTRALRLTDQLGYADLPDWDAEAIEIQYLEPGLSLLLVVPREPSLRSLAQRLAAEGISPVLQRLQERRLAVVMPLYTLRMTLLLPNKLESMGVSALVSGRSGCGALRLSHAVQRIMFWAEAGRHAYKDDGIEWDAPAEREVAVDRPYAFYVRWRNVTLMNGHFVL